MKLSPEKIDKLMCELEDNVSIEYMYAKALEYINVDEMAKAEDLTTEELSINMAIGGFKAGARFALKEIEISKIKDGEEE